MTPLFISYSDIDNFLTCRRLWRWDFVDDIRKPESLTNALATGHRVHAGIEHYYRTGNDPTVEHDRLARLALTELEDAEAPPWEIDKLMESMIVGRNCCKLHHEWLAETGADDEYDVVDVEQVVEAPILDGRVILRGKVDKLFRRKDNGMLVVDDTKTEGSWGGGTRVMMERSYQHWCYLIALRLSRPDEMVGAAQYTVIRKVKKIPSTPTTPLVSRFRVPGTTRSTAFKLRQIEAVCGEMLSAIPDGDLCYPSPGRACTWCDYRHPCELMDEMPAAAVEMLDRDFSRGGKHARYDPPK